MTGKIFDIQRFCTSDGPGIRTTVFFKGCPLRCAWCHNPESQSYNDEVLLYKNKCLKCGACERGLECPNGARRYCGRTLSVEDIIKKVSEDKPFYKNSGGGLTLSGGEPLAQADFAKALLTLAKADEIHTAVETCGFASRENMLRVAEYTDLFLFDYKLTNSKRHEEYTGVGNEIILENLRLLDSLGKAIILRCPIIPDVNDDEEHLSAIAALANELENVIAVELEPYHDFGVSKYEALGRSVTSFNVPTELEMSAIAGVISSSTHKPVKIM